MILIGRSVSPRDFGGRAAGRGFFPRFGKADGRRYRVTAGKNRLCALALAFVCALLSGCSAFPGALDVDGADAYAALPAVNADAGSAPVGDEAAVSLVRAPIYYPGAAENQYAPTLRTFRLNANARTEEKRVEELLKAPYGSEAAPAAPEGTRLAGVEVSSGLATVKLIAGADFENEEKKAILASCVAQTLLDVPGTQAVNVLVNGRALQYYGVPLGALGGETANMGEWLERLLDEKEALAREETVSREAAFYCPAKYGDYLIPEIRSVRITGADDAQTILDGLRLTPAEDALSVGLPQEYAPVKPCEIGVSAGGARVLDVFFTAEAYQAVTQPDGWKRLASIALTFTAFYPDIDGVRVRFGDLILTEVRDVNGDTLRFRDGVIAREDFSARVGALATFYFADADGKLAPETRAVSRLDVRSLRARTALLMQGPLSRELFPTFPEDLKVVDILGTALENGVAKLHFSAGFYGKCQSFTPEEETLLIYSLVNTLAADDDIRAVQVYIAGESAQTLAGTCSLRGPVLPNPGLNAR